MANYDLTPEYSALYDDNQDLFDEEEYAKLKKAGRLPEGAETKISPEAIVKALENLDYDNASRIDEKERLRNKNWYPDGGVESDAVKKSKYGDLPEKMPSGPSIPEDAPLEMGDMWDPKVSDADRAKDKEYAKRVFGEDDGGPASIDELLDAPSKQPDIAITKTMVSKPEHKKTNKPTGEKAKTPVVAAKEKVELSADTLRPHEKKSSLWDDGDIKFEGPAEKQNKELKSTLDNGYEGIDFGESDREIAKDSKGIKEEDFLGFFPGAEHKNPAKVVGDAAKAGLMGAAGGRVLSGLGRLIGKAKGGVGDLISGGIEKSNGIPGRRLNLAEKGTSGSKPPQMDIQISRKEAPSIPSGGDMVGKTMSPYEKKLAIKQLSSAVSKGHLTPEKYTKLLKGFGVGDMEIASEIARAFRK